MQKITLFIPFGRDINLLKYNLDYYTGMGINRILLSVHIRNEWEKGFLDAVKKIIAPYPAEIAEIYREAHNASKTRYENVISKHCRNDDWIIVADLDEFYEYSMPLADVVNFCEMKNYDYVSGEFLDRVGLMGELTTIHGNIWDTFPVGLRLTKMAKVCADKIVLARAGTKLTGGHHNAIEGSGCPVDDCSAIVHHFKWDSTCVERIKYMNSMHKKANLPWTIDSERTLHYLETNGGRVPIDDSRLEAYWPAYQRSVPTKVAGLQSIWQDPNRVIPKKLDSLNIEQSSDSDYIVSEGENRSLILNSSSVILLDLCDGSNRISDIVNLVRDAYPSSWHSIEYSAQTTLRGLYEAGLITYTLDSVY